jgi:succinate dehydrogenase/fumarate reductase-like Fe-S protein
MATKKGPQKSLKEEGKTVKEKEETNETREMVTVFIMGNAHRVPADATIMKALEYAGYQIKRGAGCREGFCGACGTVYRLPGDYKIYSGLACTELVKEGMWLSQLPAIPGKKAIYDLDELAANVSTIQKLYPEVFRCVACNTCTKVCPQQLEVMEYIQAAMRGDIARVMDLSFDCVSCGLCAIRCPAEIIHFNVAVLCRRLYGRYLARKSPELAKRLQELDDKKYEEEYKALMNMSREELKKKYYARDIE